MSEQSFSEATDLTGRLIRATNFLLDNWWLFLILAFALWVALKLRRQHELIGELDERADAAFADVDALLLERHGLIGNLVEVVRGFADREQEVIRDVLASRIESLEALSKGGLALAESQIAGVLQNLFTLSERYPELASAEHFGTLRTDLIRVEERITAARKFYNLAVEELNAVRRAFPGSLFAKTAAADREKFTLGERRAEFAEPVKISL